MLEGSITEAARRCFVETVRRQTMRLKRPGCELLVGGAERGMLAPLFRGRVRRKRIRRQRVEGVEEPEFSAVEGCIDVKRSIPVERVVRAMPGLQTIRTARLRVIKSVRCVTTSAAGTNQCIVRGPGRDTLVDGRERGDTRVVQAIARHIIDE